MASVKCVLQMVRCKLPERPARSLLRTVLGLLCGRRPWYHLYITIPCKVYNNIVVAAEAMYRVTAGTGWLLHLHGVDPLCFGHDTISGVVITRALGAIFTDSELA